MTNELLVGDIAVQDDRGRDSLLFISEWRCLLLSELHRVHKWVLSLYSSTTRLWVCSRCL